MIFKSLALLQKNMEAQKPDNDQETTEITIIPPRLESSQLYSQLKNLLPEASFKEIANFFLQLKTDERTPNNLKNLLDNGMKDKHILDLLNGLNPELRNPNVQQARTILNRRCAHQLGVDQFFRSLENPAPKTTPPSPQITPIPKSSQEKKWLERLTNWLKRSTD